MTRTRYFVARFAQAFGYVRRTQRLSDAASEMHLLREAESYLGQAIWEKVEHIEHLSMEYWNLRKLSKNLNEVRAKLAATQSKLDQAHENRTNLLNHIPESNQELLDHRASLLNEIGELSQTRDDIVATAREVRRSYVGLKMKLDVLTHQGDGQLANDAETTTVKQRLRELKTHFSELKQKRLEIGQKIDAADNKVSEIDEQLKNEKRQQRVLASSAFEIISDGNKEISVLRAESGLLETRMRQHYAEIGRYVCLNAHRDVSCAAAAKSHRGLIDVMHALQHSIALNHRLAGN